MKNKSLFLIAMVLNSFAGAATVNLAAGIQVITPVSGNTYIGAPLDANGNPTTFIRSTSTAPSTWAVNVSNLHDIQFQRIELGGSGAQNAGGGIKGSNCYNIGITDCVITHCLRPDTSADPQGICFTDVHDISFKNLRFEDDAWAVVFAGTSYNITGDQLIFKNCGHMLKGMWNPGSHNVHFTHIGFEDSKWGNYGSEFQPLIKNPTGLDDFSITDFYYVRPHMGTSTDSTGVISWPLEGGPGGTTNVHIARGYIDGTTSDGRKPPQFISLAMVLETSGNGNGDPVNPSCVAEDCWIRNCNDPDAMNLSATKFVIRNNRTDNVLGQFDMQGGPNSGGNIFTNNGPNVQLPAVGGWTMLGITPPGAAAAIPPATAPTTHPASSTQPGGTWLSDLIWSSAINGWGPVEKNRSNGESLGGDGNPITLNGTVYPSGLGTNSPATLIYPINGRYGRFLSDVGIDDEVGTSGSVAFQVFLDGVKAFDSGTVTGASAVQSINLDLTGKSELKLVVTDAGDGNSFDHADWANARLMPTPSTMPSSAPATQPDYAAMQNQLAAVQDQYADVQNQLTVELQNEAAIRSTLAATAAQLLQAQQKLAAITAAAAKINADAQALNQAMAGN